MNVPSLADMLLNKCIIVPPAESARTAFNTNNVLINIEKNATKPCSKCGHPGRHRSSSGRIYTTLCTKCYSERQKLMRVNRKLMR